MISSRLCCFESGTSRRNGIHLPPPSEDEDLWGFFEEWRDVTSDSSVQQGFPKVRTTLCYDWAQSVLRPGAFTANAYWERNRRATGGVLQAAE
jgi:hypothetical protein